MMILIFYLTHWLLTGEKFQSEYLVGLCIWEFMIEILVWGYFATFEEKKNEKTK